MYKLFDISIFLRDIVRIGYVSVVLIISRRVKNESFMVFRVSNSQRSIFVTYVIFIAVASLSINISLSLNNFVHVAKTSISWLSNRNQTVGQTKDIDSDLDCRLREKRTSVTRCT